MNFSFQLTGKKWFGLYLCIIVFYLIPVIVMQVLSAHLKANPYDYTAVWSIFALFIIIIATIFLVTVPVIRIFLEHTYFNDKSFSFTGKTPELVWLNIKGFFLTIITLCIYYPWFITNLMSFFIGKTVYKDTAFSFNGKAITLLKIFLLLMMLPMIAYVICFVIFFKEQANDPVFAIINQIVVSIIMIPFTVSMYNWIINISYKSYTIQWETPLMQTIGVVFREFFLTIITVGIYFPVALAKIARLLTRQTYINSDNNRLYQCDANYDYGNIWKTFWIQIILTIITCGIYGAWAYSNIARAYVNPISVVKV